MTVRTLQLNDATGEVSAATVSGGLQSRTTATATTSSLAPGAADSSTTIELALGYRLYTIETSRPARVRLYATAAQRDADLARAIGTDPLSTDGVMLDFVTIAGSTVYDLGPLVDGVSLEASPDATTAMTVTNLDSGTGTVVVTLGWIRTE